MVDVRTPATLGVVSAVVYTVATALPYVAGDVPGEALQTYYTAFGAVGPPYITVLALVSLVVLGASRAGRTALDSAAGVGIVLGGLATLLTGMWAFGGVAELVGSLSKASWLEYHRWVLLAAAFGIFTGSLWLADAIGVLRARPDAAS